MTIEEIKKIAKKRRTFKRTGCYVLLSETLWIYSIL